MTSVSTLTWADELRLSDDIHAARSLRALLAREGRAPTTSEASVLEKADDAIRTLVVSHTGLVKGLALNVTQGRQHKYAAVDYDDLVQAGLIALQSCARAFDARRRADGIAKDTGTRFSVYSRMRVRRDMWRLVDQASPLSQSGVTLANTYAWVRFASELRLKLGREPRPDEVSEASGINPEAVDVTLLATPVFIDDVANPGSSRLAASLHETNDPAGDLEEAMMASAYTDALAGVLAQVLPQPECEALTLWLGVDQEMPRSISEVARQMGVPRRDASALIEFAQARLRHPQSAGVVRKLALGALASVEGRGTPSTATVATYGRGAAA